MPLPMLFQITLFNSLAMSDVCIFVTVFMLLPNILYGVDLKRYASEIAMGDPADLMGTNPHHAQAAYYQDFSRRFVPQYPYVEVADDKVVETDEGDIIPQRASPEVVLDIARQSALLARTAPEDPADESIRKQILRSGNYWNGVWEEAGNEKKILRSPHHGQALSTVKVKIMPGNKYYDLLSRLQKISPRLLYIINKKNYDYIWFNL